MFLKKNFRSEKQWNSFGPTHIPKKKEPPPPSPSVSPRVSKIVQLQPSKFFEKILAHTPSQNYVITENINICVVHLKWKVLGL